MPESIVESLEGELHELAKAWADPHEGECLLCYVYRMLGRFDCAGLRWATHYRDRRGSTQHCRRWMRRPRGLFAGW